MTYKDLLKMGKEALEAAQIPFRAKEMRIKAELETAKLESAIAEKDAKISEAQSKYPIDFERVITLMDEKGLMERKLKQFKKITDELFPA